MEYRVVGLHTDDTYSMMGAESVVGRHSGNIYSVMECRVVSLYSGDSVVGCRVVGLHSGDRL